MSSAFHGQSEILHGRCRRRTWSWSSGPSRPSTNGYLACCTGDVQLITPIADVAGAYDGREGIRRFFADIADTAPDFKITIERLEAVGANRVLVHKQRGQRQP
jgi:SnoaL-like domain